MTNRDGWPAHGVSNRFGQVRSCNFVGWSPASCKAFAQERGAIGAESFRRYGSQYCMVKFPASVDPVCAQATGRSKGTPSQSYGWYAESDGGIRALPDYRIDGVDATIDNAKTEQAQCFWDDNWPAKPEPSI